MRTLRRLLTLTALITLGAAVPAGAGASSVGAVYVLTNQASGNAVAVFTRAADGSLTAAGTFATGGLGTGGGLGSQGAVTLDNAGRYLYAVDAGSDTVTSFRVVGDGLARVSTVPSGGTRPISVTVHGSTVYVLNSAGIAGFTAAGGVLTPLAGSNQALSGPNVGPAQVGFTPDGSKLVVTEKATNNIDVFAVDAGGVAGPAQVFAGAGVTPFGFGFDNKGHLIVSEAAGGALDGSTVSSYDLSDGLSEVSAAVPTTETAACWIAVTNDGRHAYAANAGSASLSGYDVRPDGSLALTTPGGKTGTTSANPIDIATSVDSSFLYARLGNGSVAGFSVAADGSLAAVPGAAGLPAGAAGIAAR